MQSYLCFNKQFIQSKEKKTERKTQENKINTFSYDLKKG